MKRLNKKQKEKITKKFKEFCKRMSLDNALIKIAAIIIDYQLRDKR